jgi:RecB family exonuclease
MRALSPTALKTFSECPKRFHYAYIARPEIADVPSPLLVMGNAIHAALAFFFRLPIEDRAPQVLPKALRHFWAEEKDRDQAFTSRDEEIGWGNRALEALTWFAQTYDLDRVPIAIEEWLEAELPGGALVGGKVDRVDERPDGNGLEVTDYKTGKAKLEDEDLPRDFAAQIYTLTASRSFGQPVTRVRLIYLTERVERRWEVESEDLDQIAGRLEDSVIEIHDAVEFPARPDRHCRFCRYRRICPDRDRTDVAQLRTDVETPF